MIKISTGVKQAIIGDGTTDSSLRNLLAGGVLRFYSGTQPSSANDIESGILLSEITLSSGAFTPGAAGSSTNGLRFEAAVDGVIDKLVSETWSGLGLAVGSIGWFRFYDSNRNTGSSTSSVRIDGSVATSGGDLTMSSTTVGVDTPITVPTFSITLPSY